MTTAITPEPWNSLIAQLLGGQVGRERHDQRDGRVEDRLGDPAPDGDHHERHDTKPTDAPRRPPR